jgi:hypothetical protein
MSAAAEAEEEAEEEAEFEAEARSKRVMVTSIRLDVDFMT